MKIGIISDIHANAANLKRAIVLLREKGAEEILCAGDLVDGATEGNEAAQLVRAQEFPCVQGNHDHAMVRATSAQYTEWRKQWDAAELDFHPWQYGNDMLTDETIGFLRELPLQQRVEREGKRILLTHASAWDQVTYLYANGRQDYFERIAEEADADAVIVGHTHIPMAVWVKHVWVFNPGSVDGNRLAPYNSTCALLTLPEMHFEVFDIGTQRPVQYIRTRL